MASREPVRCPQARFGREAVTAARWDCIALRKLRDSLYLRRVSPNAFLRSCDLNGDGHVSRSELQAVFLEAGACRWHRMCLDRQPTCPALC